MGAVKQWMIEQTEREAPKQEGYCASCGKKLDRDRKRSGRDICFECYCDEQD
jgi:hypothetical protein